jgi:hypothetical protein
MYRLTLTVTMWMCIDVGIDTLCNLATLYILTQAVRVSPSSLISHSIALTQALTDSHCRDIGDYDALVICHLAGFEDGELLLYERLQMVPMLLERYAQDGSIKARRQMLAMCQSDPEVLADVLGHFVAIASERLNVVSDIVSLFVFSRLHECMYARICVYGYICWCESACVCLKVTPNINAAWLYRRTK